MKRLSGYVALDGTIFRYKAECLRYEKKFREQALLKHITQNLDEPYDSSYMCDRTRPADVENYIKKNWEFIKSYVQMIGVGE